MNECGAAAASAVDSLVREAYEAYSGQDVERLLDLLADDVDWPDGDRRLHGRAAVRHYWTEQWTRTRTYDAPTAIAWLTDAVCAVRIDQVVRSVRGEVVSQGRLVHVLQLDGRRIGRLDIVPVTPMKEQTP